MTVDEISSCPAVKEHMEVEVERRRFDDITDAHVTLSTLSPLSHLGQFSFSRLRECPDSTRVCMPPGPAFNWLAAAHSALVILDHALQYRAAQVTRVGGIRVSQSRQRARSDGVYKNGWEEKGVVEEQLVTPTADEPPGPSYVLANSLLHANDAWLRQLEIVATPQTPIPETVLEQQHSAVDSTPVEPKFTISATAEARPPAVEPVVLAADVNLSRLDARSPRHPPIPESDVLPDEVLLNRSLRFTVKSETCSVAAAGA